MLQMAVSNQKIINVSSMFFDPNRDSAAIGRAALQSAGVLNSQYQLHLDAAMEYAKASPPELVFVDLSPDTEVEGLKLIRFIRAEKTDKPPRIMAFLGKGTRDALITAIKGGADTVVVKPLAPDSLHKKIKQLLQAPQNYITATKYYGPDRRRVPSEDEYGGDERRRT
ncbi:MAG: response regulator [Alphaproteobacteria bacterium]|nr:response regulator [Alphaproteobacteria bacterium]